MKRLVYYGWAAVALISAFGTAYWDTKDAVLEMRNKAMRDLEEQTGERINRGA